jgi:hypothetical protein
MTPVERTLVAQALRRAASVIESGKDNVCIQYAETNFQSGEIDLIPKEDLSLAFKVLQHSMREQCFTFYKDSVSVVIPLRRIDYDIDCGHYVVDVWTGKRHTQGSPS